MGISMENRNLQIWESESGATSDSDPGILQVPIVTSISLTDPKSSRKRRIMVSTPFSCQ